VLLQINSELLDLTSLQLYNTVFHSYVFYSLIWTAGD